MTHNTAPIAYNPQRILVKKLTQIYRGLKERIVEQFSIWKLLNLGVEENLDNKPSYALHVAYN